MSTTITLSGALPAGKRNGIGDLTGALLRGDEAGHMVIAAVSLSKTTTHSGGKVTFALTIDDIEAYPIDTPGWDVARGLLEQQRESRTGEVALPFEEPA
ncbi:hypothetical protein [Amycolatopsis kentuckyensis]|uniref:hypothetical protein n=1 Tax=Amycolatopsis kentuckyensis TaxID=218823 RepID=UPI00356242C4